jgi:hypothetical protein
MLMWPVVGRVMHPQADMFLLHETTDLLKITKLKKIVKFEVLTARTMENSVFWDVAPRGFCKKRRFGETTPSSC